MSNSPDGPGIPFNFRSVRIQRTFLFRHFYYYFFFFSAHRILFLWTVCFVRVIIFLTLYGVCPSYSKKYESSQRRWRMKEMLVIKWATRSIEETVTKGSREGYLKVLAFFDRQTWFGGPTKRGLNKWAIIGHIMDCINEQNRTKISIGLDGGGVGLWLNRN